MVMIGICKSVDIETEVNVTVDDITAALHERLEEVDKRYDAVRVNDQGRRRELLGYVNSVYACLHAVTNQMIESAGESHRETIAKALQAEAKRWAAE